MKIKYLGTAAAEGFPSLFCECDVCKKARELGGRNFRSRSQALIYDDLYDELVGLVKNDGFIVSYDGLEIDF